MSWVTDIENEFIITTGDGKKFKPRWRNPAFGVEYNISQFEFPGISGSLVRRGKPKGAKYALEIYFQGEDHLEQSAAFKTSADDSRAWNISHPFYGALIVQPVSLTFDNTRYNVTTITGEVIETITEDSPKVTVAPVDKILSDKDVLDENIALSFAVDIPAPDVNNMAKMTESVTTVYNEGKKKIKLTEDAEAYFNKFNQSLSDILNATALPLAAIRGAQAVINAPFSFQDSVRNRLNIMIAQFNLLRTSVTTLLRPSDKKVYESNMTTMVSGMAACTVTETDYQSRPEVLAIMEDVTAVYNALLSDLDYLQTETGGDPDSYIPNARILRDLGSLIDFTVANLFNIALDSKQERSIYCEEDTNAILLCHRFYGMDDTDTNLDKLIATNNIGLNELLSIKKGRKIVYYV